MTADRGRRRRCCVVGVLAGALVLGGCANGPGASTRPAVATAPVPDTGPRTEVNTGAVRLIGDRASVELDPETQRDFEDEQMHWITEESTEGQLPGYADGTDTLNFPVTGGTVDASAVPPRGRITTAGSAMITREGNTLSLSDLEIDLDGRRVTATVDGRRSDVMMLDTSRAHLEDLPHSPPAIVDLAGRLTDDTDRELRDHLGVPLSGDDVRVDIEVRLRPS